jgi:hypothetical protein
LKRWSAVAVESGWQSKAVCRYFWIMKWWPEKIKVTCNLQTKSKSRGLSLGQGPKLGHPSKWQLVNGLFMFSGHLFRRCVGRTSTARTFFFFFLIKNIFILYFYSIFKCELNMSRRNMLKIFVDCGLFLF